ncbi:MAG: 30S ribosomal protein S6 [Parcubacteria group bacterium]|nr:30S ribosomal protein S6 [Parcubacteria group bacterium]
MKEYELFYLVPSQFTDDEVTGIQKIVADLLKANEATILRDENLGKVTLAYPIKRVTHGTYVIVHFDAEPSVIKELDRKLKLTDEVLRHMLLARAAGAVEKKIDLSSYVAPLNEEGRRTMGEEEKEEAPRAPRAPHSAPAAPVAPATPTEPKEPAVEAPVEEVVKIAPPTPSATTAEETKMTMEELDQKLDKILDGDIADNI